MSHGAALFSLSEINFATEGGVETGAASCGETLEMQREHAGIVTISYETTKILCVNQMLQFSLVGVEGAKCYNFLLWEWRELYMRIQMQRMTSAASAAHRAACKAPCSCADVT